MSMRLSKKGFTLIELLVVIAIIALLLSVIMPALGLAKEKARAVVCKSNLKQWGVMLALYTQENNDSYMPGYASNPDGRLWWRPLKPYYGEGSSEKVRLCPTTSMEKSHAFFQAWTLYDPTQPAGPGNEPDYTGLSYGINNWVYNPPASVTEMWNSHLTVNNWRKTTNMTNTGSVPVFMDAFRHGGHPEAGDTAPSRPIEDPATLKDAAKAKVKGGFGEMNRFNLDRHQGTVNVLFADSGVEKVTLRGLWGLKWHKEYSGSAEMTRMDNAGWPAWMKK
ncbi:MAG: type II secretion system protein [Planctomycetota bacterium]